MQLNDCIFLSFSFQIKSFFILRLCICWSNSLISWVAELTQVNLLKGIALFFRF